MKTDFFAAIPFVALCALTSPMVQAVEASLAVGGQIKPVACDVSFAAGGIFDYGNFHTSTLAATGETPLARITQTYNIICTGATLVAVAMKDNRLGTVPNPADTRYGLGVDQAGNNIGKYNLYVTGRPIVDGTEGIALTSATGGASWADATLQPLIRHNCSRRCMISFATVGGTVPSPVTTVVAQIDAQATIVDKSFLDLTRTVGLDGSSTMEIVYL